MFDDERRRPTAGSYQKMSEVVYVGSNTKFSIERSRRGVGKGSLPQFKAPFSLVGKFQLASGRVMVALRSVV